MYPRTVVLLEYKYLKVLCYSCTTILSSARSTSTWKYLKLLNMAVLQVLTSTLRKYLSSSQFFSNSTTKTRVPRYMDSCTLGGTFIIFINSTILENRDGTLFLLNIGKCKKSTQTGLLAILNTVLKWIVIIGKNFVNIGKKSIIAKTAEKT